MARKVCLDSMYRRSFIGTVSAGLLGSTAVGQVSANETETETVNVAEAGADTSGNEPIDDIISDVLTDNTRLLFPEGRYKINFISLYGLSNAALIGEGDVELVPGSSWNEDLWIGGTHTRDLTFENFTIDNTDDGVGISIQIGCHDGLTVKDVSIKGRNEIRRPAFGLRILDESGSGIIENLSMPDGGTSVAVYTDPVGTLVYRNCHSEGFANNGIYGSYASGEVIIDGGFYKNNNVTSIRLSSDGSIVKDATIVVDDPPSDYGNCRGVRVAEGDGPVAIENCKLYMKSGRGTGAIVGAFNGGSFTVTDTAIYIGEDYTTVGSGGKRTSYAIYVDPSTDGVVGERTITRTIVSGTGNYVAPVRFARDNNTLVNVCIEQAGHRRNGVLFRDSINNSITDSVIDVPGDQVVLEGDSSVDQSNIQSESDCEWPSETELEEEITPEEQLDQESDEVTDDVDVDSWVSDGDRASEGDTSVEPESEDPADEPWCPHK